MTFTSEMLKAAHAEALRIVAHENVAKHPKNRIGYQNAYQEALAAVAFLASQQAPAKAARKHDDSCYGFQIVEPARWNGFSHR